MADPKSAALPLGAAPAPRIHFRLPAAGCAPQPSAWGCRDHRDRIAQAKAEQLGGTAAVHGDLDQPAGVAKPEGLPGADVAEGAGAMEGEPARDQPIALA